MIAANDVTSSGDAAREEAIRVDVIRNLEGLIFAAQPRVSAALAVLCGNQPDPADSGNEILTRGLQERVYYGFKVEQ